MIPDEVMIEGTFRTMDEKWRFEAHEWIRTIARSTAEASGARCEVDIRMGYPVLINHEKLSEKMVSAMREYLEEKNVIEIPQRMTSEDFAFYCQKVPAFFYRLGTAGENNLKSAPVHTQVFDIDDDALQTGSGMLAWLALQAMDF